MSRLKKLRQRQRQKANEWSLKKRKAEEEQRYKKWQSSQIATLFGIFDELLQNEKRYKNSPQSVDKSEKH